MANKLLSLAIAALLLSTCFSAEIRLYPTQSTGTGQRYKKFTISGAQVCYTLDTCYDNLTVMFGWSDIQKNTRLVFFDGSECSGKWIYLPEFLTSGMTDLSASNFGNKLSSFLLWENSIWPVRGMKNICLDDEEESVLIEAASNTSAQV